MNETNTFKKFKNSPQDNFPEYIIVHHSGGTDQNPLEDTSNHTAKIMEDYHLSKGWEGLGYQYVIHKNGDVWAGRPETYHGAHTVDYNKKSIGICLAGNFDATLPTLEQIKSLTNLMNTIKVKYNIPLEKIVPHRTFATKTCYGNKLKDDWARSLLQTNNKEDIKKQIIDLVNKL